MTLSQEQRKYFNECIKDILSCEQVLQLDRYKRHGNITCFRHSVAVAYYSYLLCSRLGKGVNCRSVIRGALLHDFFPYENHEKRTRGPRGRSYSKAVLENAESYFWLNIVERDIIQMHRWPLTVKLPKYKETFVVSMVDKCCCVVETFHLFSNTNFLSNRYK